MFCHRDNNVLNENNTLDSTGAQDQKANGQVQVGERDGPERRALCCVVGWADPVPVSGAWLPGLLLIWPQHHKDKAFKMVLLNLKIYKILK